MSGNGNFYGDSGFAIDSGSNLWVVDTGNNRVQKFDSNGNYLSELGSGYGTSGSGNGQSDTPMGIAISGR